MVSLLSGAASALVVLAVMGVIARWRMRRLLRQMAAAAARRPCTRACGREALDGHLTCGDVVCDERGAREEQLARLNREREARLEARTAKIRRMS